MILFELTVVFFGALGTYKLSDYKSFGGVRSSSLMTIVCIAIINFASGYLPLETLKLYALVFGASFVGMCSSKKFRDLEIVISSLIYLAFFYYLIPHLDGIGGALGFSAFLSVLITKAIGTSYSQIRAYLRALQ